MNTFRHVIDLWPSRRAFAAALNVKESTAGNMYLRDSIDAKYFDRVVEAAKEIERPDITHELLCKIAAAPSQ